MATIIKEDLIKGLRGRMDRNGRQFTRSVVVGGLTGSNTTTYFTTAYDTVGTNIGDAWPDTPSPATNQNSVNVYCSSYDFNPLSADQCEIVYTYDSYPFDMQVDIGTVEMQEETIFDGAGNMITTTLDGETIPMKVVRCYSNVERILRWSEFNSYANISSYFAYRDCTDASAVWRCRSVTAQNADNNYVYGLWLMSVRLEAKADQWKDVTWLDDSKGYPITSTITTVYPYPATVFPSGWL